MRHRTPDVWTGNISAKITILVGCRISEEDGCRDEEAARCEAVEKMREEFKDTYPDADLDEVEIDQVDQNG